MNRGKLTSYLENVVSRFDTYSYEFDLELTEFLENNKGIKGYELDQTIPLLLQEGKTDTAFACLYLFTILLKRANNLDGLENVVNKYSSYFDEDQYPLILEIKSRYLKRKKGDIDSWEKALRCDKKALKLLKGVYYAKSTYGVNASYVSTVCRILKYGAAHPESLERISAFLSPLDCQDGIEYIDENIHSNSGYAKNYYLKAQLLYFEMMVFHRLSHVDLPNVAKRCGECDAIVEQLSIAITKEKVLTKQESYRFLANEISAYQSSLAAMVKNEALENIEQSTSFEKCINPFCHARVKGKKYVFVCYSRTDYKAVFEDIYDLYCQNIPMRFDSIVRSGESWITSVEKAVFDDDCAAVLFFLSQSAMMSDSIFREVQLLQNEAFRQKRYLYVSVNGLAPSKLLFDIYQEHDYDPLFRNSLTPERISTILSFFNDSIHFLSRQENDYREKLASDIRNVFLTQEGQDSFPQGVRVVAHSYTESNNRLFEGTQKPNEDYYVSDQEKGIFIVADGVTRPHDEYKDEAKANAASEITKAFCESVLRELLQEIPLCHDEEEVQRLLIDAFSKGNEEIKRINETTPSKYLPATVALAGVLFEGRLVYAYIGDCIGVLVRNGNRLIFAERQTVAVKKEGVGKEELYARFVNKPGQRHGYGILNGDHLASAFCHASSFVLQPNDHIFLSTDGLADMLLYEDPQLLAREDFIHLIPSLSAIYDAPPFSEYRDDKALIHLIVKE